MKQTVLVMAAILVASLPVHAGAAQRCYLLTDPSLPPQATPLNRTLTSCASPPAGTCWWHVESWSSNPPSYDLWLAVPASWQFGSCRFFNYGGDDSFGHPIVSWLYGFCSPWTCTVVSYALSVTRTGSGAGSVASSPTGINCPVGSCSASFTSGTLVTLTATPNANSIFTGWSGAGCSGTSTCTVTMNGAKSVTANFQLVSYALSVTRTGSGAGSVASSPTGINCPVGSCSASFTSGTLVTLTATPNANSIFTGWSGAGCSGTSTCTVTMNGAKSVTANFQLASYALNVTLAGSGAGSVVSSPAGINCSAGSCSAFFTSGTLVTLTATPDANSTFTGWSARGAAGRAPAP